MNRFSISFLMFILMNCMLVGNVKADNDNPKDKNGNSKTVGVTIGQIVNFFSGKTKDTGTTKATCPYVIKISKSGQPAQLDSKLSLILTVNGVPVFRQNGAEIGQISATPKSIPLNITAGFINIQFQTYNDTVKSWSDAHTYLFELYDFNNNQVWSHIPKTPKEDGLPYMRDFATKTIGNIRIFSCSDKPVDNTDYRPNVLKGPGLTLNDIIVSGTVRFITIYRGMEQSYQDMVSSANNFSFQDYPLSNVGATNNGGFPMLELNLATKPQNPLQFNVGYSFGHTLSGVDGLTDITRQVSSRQNLKFGGVWNAGLFKLRLDAGGVLWKSLSRFTMGQTNYRDNYFDRVPWDWYRNSFLRFEEYYSLSTNIGQESSGRSPVIGVLGLAEIIPTGTRVHLVYGRTNRSASYSNTTNGFPSEIFGTRIEQSIFHRRMMGKIGFNHYRKTAWVSASNRKADNIVMSTLDYDFKLYKIHFSGEIGMTDIINPAYNNANENKTFFGETGASGWGFTFKAEVDKQIMRFPMGLEFYYINKNMISLDGSIMNSNENVRDGGYATEKVYDAMFLPNIIQQVGQIANNRMGFNFQHEGNISKLKYQVGLGSSIEIENLFDSITFQHRVNSFSRSRFNPWNQAGGEYARIKSFWLTTFQTVAIEDSNGGNPYKKGFTTLELFLKYKLKIAGRDFVILNFNTFNTAQKQNDKNFGWLPFGEEKPYIFLFFEDINFAYKVGKKWNVVANYGFQGVWGNDKVNGVSNIADPDYGKAIESYGHAVGCGLDYDFASFAGIHLRYKYMTHEDKNYTRDKFRGHEVYLELKGWF